MSSRETEKYALDLVQKLTEQQVIFNQEMHSLRLELANTRGALANASQRIEQLARQLAVDRAEQQEIQRRTREFLGTAQKVLGRYL